MWHSNPLAGSSPAKLVPRLPVAPAGPQSADQPAETVRARPSAPAAQAHEAASVAAAPAAAEDEWVWGQGSAASSPSLRLPAAPAEAAEQPRLQLLPPQDVQPTDSGGAASLSRHWQLPSPGGENS